MHGEHRGRRTPARRGLDRSAVNGCEPTRPVTPPRSNASRGLAAPWPGPLPQGTVFGTWSFSVRAVGSFCSTWRPSVVAVVLAVGAVRRPFAAAAGRGSAVPAGVSRWRAVRRASACVDSSSSGVFAAFRQASAAKRLRRRMTRRMLPKARRARMPAGKKPSEVHDAPRR